MKRFGIRAKMDPSDPMAAPHLLGPDFQAERWFASREERDRILADLQSGRPYYRQGDIPSIQYEPIEEKILNSFHSQSR